MVAYRYTKIVVDASNDGNGDIIAAEIELRTTAGSADLTTAALAATRASGTAGWYSSAEGPDKAFNDNTGNWWQPRGAGSYIIWDHGAGTPQNVEAIRWLANGSFPGRTPNKFTVWGSNDLVSWTQDWAQIDCGPWTDWTSPDRLFTSPTYVGSAELKVAKQLAAAVLIQPNLTVAKQAAFAAFTQPNLTVAKQVAYAVFHAPEVRVAKQVAYVVFMDEALPPVENRRRMSLM